MALAKVQLGGTEVLESFEGGETGETKENLLPVIKRLEKSLEKSETEKELWQAECQKVNQKYKELQGRLLTIAQE
jgi:hypothetical protein